MSHDDHSIRPGDEVFVMFDQSQPRGGLYGRVEYCPQATGDSFHIRDLDAKRQGELYYVQTFQFMHLRKRGP